MAKVKYELKADHSHASVAFRSGKAVEIDASYETADAEEQQVLDEHPALKRAGEKGA